VNDAPINPVEQQIALYIECPLNILRPGRAKGIDASDRLRHFGGRECRQGTDVTVFLKYRGWARCGWGGWHGQLNIPDIRLQPV